MSRYDRESRSEYIFDPFTDDLTRRAEEMCASLKKEIQIDRRGQATYYPGAIADLTHADSGYTKVTVAEGGKNHFLTIISDAPLEASKESLLVYRLAPGNDMKYLGRIKASRPGVRQDDPENTFITLFDIIRDVRKEP